jgi:hypothetical protein
MEVMNNLNKNLYLILRSWKNHYIIMALIKLKLKLQLKQWKILMNNKFLRRKSYILKLMSQNYLNNRNYCNYLNNSRKLTMTMKHSWKTLIYILSIITSKRQLQVKKASYKSWKVYLQKFSNNFLDKATKYI